jgi:hypothetical protein
MKTLEMTAVVGLDRKLTVQLPPDINPGAHRLVVVIEEMPPSGGKPQPLQFSTYPVDINPKDFTFRREDLYGDDGR